MVVLSIDKSHFFSNKLRNSVGQIVTKPFPDTDITTDVNDIVLNKRKVQTYTYGTKHQESSRTI